MPQVLRVWTCLLVTALGVAPPLMITPQVRPAVAGMVAAQPADSPSSAQLSPHPRGQPPIVPAQAKGINTEGKFMRTFPSTPPARVDGALQKWSVHQHVLQFPSLLTEHIHLLGAFVFAAVAAAMANSRLRQWCWRVPGVKKELAIEMAASGRVAWSELERPKFAMAAFASEQPFDPVGLMIWEMSHSPEASRIQEIKHGRRLLLTASRPQAMESVVRRAASALVPLAATLNGSGPVFANEIGDSASKRAITANMEPGSRMDPGSLMDGIEAHDELAAAASSMLLAEDVAPFMTAFGEEGPDTYFFVWILLAFAFIGTGTFLITKPYWEQRSLIEKVNSQKLKLISQSGSSTPLDKFQLGRYYSMLPDYSSALAEYDEVEEDFEDMRKVLDPEDAMGALARRAMLHNSKGFCLANLEPPRTAQARREYVRAVTFWPEYPEGLLNIGSELIQRKRYSVAARTLNTALKWQPANTDMQALYQEALRGATGAESTEYDDDEDYYRKF